MIRRSLGLALCLLGTAALAQSRPTTTTMTCAAAQALVMSSHAVVLGTGGQTYDRFVSDQSRCNRDQIAEPTFAPTLDQPQCMIGFRCKEEARDVR